MHSLLHYLLAVDGYWTLWSNWTACSVSCGGGSRSRSRECIPPMHGGNPCEDINNEEVEECNTQHCPSKFACVCSKTVINAVVLPLVDGKWSSWSEWSACSVTCGSGIHSRTRTCTPPQYGGKDCEGSSTEVNVCLKSDCIGKKGATIKLYTVNYNLIQMLAIPILVTVMFGA